MRVRPLLLLALSIAPSFGCNGPAAAARDFFDPYRVVVGVGTGAGVRVHAGGWVHTGLLFGVKPDSAALGWKYGKPLLLQPPKDEELRAEIDQSYLVLTTSVFDLDYPRGAYALGRRSLFLLPALASWVDSADPDAIEWQVPDEGVALEGERWIWSPDAIRDQRFAQVHAFDWEVEVMLGVYVDLGFSPGEWFDFWFSLVGLDLAQDDDR